MFKVMAGSDDGLDCRQPEGLQAPDSYTAQVTHSSILLKLISNQVDNENYYRKGGRFGYQQQQQQLY